MPPDPKPAKRILDRYASSRKLKADQACRFCRHSATDGHHILLRSQSGDDVEDNILPLCHTCHMSYHAGSLASLDLSDAERLYVQVKLGVGADSYLERRGYS